MLKKKTKNCTFTRKEPRNFENLLKIYISNNICSHLKRGRKHMFRSDVFRKITRVFLFCFLKRDLQNNLLT